MNRLYVILAVAQDTQDTAELQKVGEQIATCVRDFLFAAAAVDPFLDGAAYMHVIGTQDIPNGQLLTITMGVDKKTNDVPALQWLGTQIAKVVYAAVEESKSAVLEGAEFKMAVSVGPIVRDRDVISKLKGSQEPMPPKLQA